MGDLGTNTTGDTERIEGGARVEPPPSLLVYSRAGSSIVPIDEGASLTIGRGAEASVVVADSSLSRLHARVTRQAGVVTIADLGSTNGVYVNGARVERSLVAPGDEVDLGAARLSLHEPAARAQLERGVVGHETLRSLIEHELARSRFFGRSFALGYVCTRGKNGGLGPKLARLGRGLRAIDRLAFHGPHGAVVLLPEIEPEAARRLLEGVCGEAGLHAGLAAYPAAAVSVEGLVEAARDAALTVASGSAVAVAVASSAGAPRVVSDELDPIVASPAMARLFQTVASVAQATLPVIVCGESGSGKEVVARAIHRLGPRKDAPMIALSCASIPGQLVETTLFGHERGAFTSASRESRGVFEAADGGTVFLDEIGELPLPAQAALLRVLETLRVVRVGSTKEIPVNVRVIAATHRDLEAAAERGEFRRDLLFRLDGMTLRVLPLRERVEEIRPLAERFAARAAKECAREIDGLDASALELLHRYAWPGNVRELKNVIARAVVVARGRRISAEDLPERLRREAQRVEARVEPEAPEACPTDLKEALVETERRMILAALRETGWNQTRAAERLKLPVRTLAYKIRILGIVRAGRGE